MAIVAERAFTSRPTLQRVEAGDTNVSIGIYAGVLHAIGLLDGLSQIADISRKVIEFAWWAGLTPNFLVRSFITWRSLHRPIAYLAKLIAWSLPFKAFKL